MYCSVQSWQHPRNANFFTASAKPQWLWILLPSFKLSHLVHMWCCVCCCVINHSFRRLMTWGNFLSVLLFAIKYKIVLWFAPFLAKVNMRCVYRIGFSSNMCIMSIFYRTDYIFNHLIFIFTIARIFFILIYFLVRFFFLWVCEYMCTV